MDQFLRDPSRDTLLYVHDLDEVLKDDLFDAVKKVGDYLSRPIKVLLVSDKRDKNLSKVKLPSNFTRIRVNTNSVRQLEKALNPYLHSIVAIVCRAESYIPYFKNIIPHVPYVEAPTQESLDWATNKIMMRRRLVSFNKRISPKYTIVNDTTPATIAKIKRKVGFPLIVKPAGLAASVLVSVCYHEEELQQVLQKSLAKLKSAYKDRSGRGVPALLVEELMDGTMYSVDIYVNSRGTMYATPMVRVVTAFMKGQDDFYGYSRTTPTGLKLHKQHKGIQVAKEGVEALGLRSITAHVELMLTEEGWKVIEIGPRIGGFRHEMYKLSYGLNHMLNDILIRLPMRPEIKRKAKGYTTVLQFYPQVEGVIETISGLKRITQLNSYVRYRTRLKAGDYARFARHGGMSVVDLVMFNKSRSDLLADVRRAEQSIKIQIQPKKREVIPKIITEVTPEILADK